MADPKSRRLVPPVDPLGALIVDAVATRLTGIVAIAVGEALREHLAPVLGAAVRQALDEQEPPRRPALLTPSQLADELRISTRTVAHLRDRGLPVVFVGDSPRYELDRVLAWLRDRTGHAADKLTK